jgi:hypothetical protein
LSSTNDLVRNDFRVLLTIVSELPSWLADDLRPLIGSLFRDINNNSHTLKDFDPGDPGWNPPSPPCSTAGGGKGRIS